MTTTQLLSLSVLILWCLSGIITTLIYIFEKEQQKYIKNYFKTIDICIMCLFGPFTFFNSY